MGKMQEKYLPLGTIVILKNMKKRLMITGFCQIEKEDDKETRYDYCGCMYPEGHIGFKNVILFNHDQIGEIYYLGFAEDEEEKEFKTNLKKILK